MKDVQPEEKVVAKAILAHQPRQILVRRPQHAELEPVGHWSAYDHRAAAPIACTRCFQACRGEVQAPINLRRVVEVLRM